MKTLALVPILLLSSTLAKADASVPFQVQNVAAGTCWNIPNSSRSESMIVQSYRCSGHTNTLFKLVKNGRSYFVRNVNSALCIDISKGSLAENTRVAQQRCIDKAHRLWEIRSAGRGLFEFVAKHSEKCITVIEPEFNGSTMLQRTCKGYDTQHYRLIKQETGIAVQDIEDLFE